MEGSEGNVWGGGMNLNGAQIEERLTQLQRAISDLEGVPIRFDVIQKLIVPLKNWLDEELGN